MLNIQERASCVKINATEIKDSAIRWLKKTWCRFLKSLEILRQKPLIRPTPVELQEEELAPGLAQPEFALQQPAVRPGHPMPITHKVKPIRRHGREKVYRLKGYTTIAKVNRRRQSERQQRFLRRLMIGIIVILIIILLFNLYNPFTDLREWYRIIGVKDVSDLTSNLTTSKTTATSAQGTTAEVATTTISGQPTTVKTTKP
jgi:hypothetical protein